MISILLGIGAIVGAIKFNAILVGSNVAWMVASFIAGCIVAPVYCNSWDDKSPYYSCSINWSVIIFGIVSLAAWAYPQVMFVWEVKRDIMSAETYEREKYSCCCTSAAVTTDAAQSSSANAAVAEGNANKNTESWTEIPLGVTSSAPTASTAVAAYPSEPPTVKAKVAPLPDDSIKVTETTLPDGTKQIKKEETHADGSKTITISTAEDV